MSLDIRMVMRDFAVSTARLAEQRLGRLRAEMDRDDVGLAVLGAPANIQYALGYRSVSSDIFRQHQMIGFVSRGELALALGMADTAPAMDCGLAPAELLPYGRFYFDGASGVGLASPDDGGYENLQEAATAALDRFDLNSGRIAVDWDGLIGAPQAIEAALSGLATVDAKELLIATRGIKLAGEVERLERAAQLAEKGISMALSIAEPGMRETQLADALARTMAAGGSRPTLLVATAGRRTALADTFSSPDQVIAPGDLLRFDVGCRIDGYYSDMARTAVMGQPTAIQKQRYEAILAGEQSQLELVKPGVRANELFNTAVSTVRKHGIATYGRHHCGHGIGLDMYEHPIIAPSSEMELQAGMTFCFETPYYELGWGGMMVEDTIIVTDEGHRRFTQSDRELRVVEA